MRKQPAEELQPFALELIRLRGEAGLSMRKLSERTGISPKSIVALEHARQRPTAPTLASLARGLGVPTQQLVEVLHSYPFDARPRAVRRLLEDAGVETAWVVAPHEDLMQEAATRERDGVLDLIGEIRREQRAIRSAEADTSYSPEMRSYFAWADQEADARMDAVLAESRELTSGRRGRARRRSSESEEAGRQRNAG